MAAKITSKTNHDSLWVKVSVSPKAWVKLVINRGGVSIKHSANHDFSAYIKAFEAVYGAWKGTKSTYGALVKDTEAAWTLV